jgi:hypothetical protein
MKIENIVTSVETSNKLKNAGYLKKAIFSYFKDKNDKIYISETDFSSDEHITFAYTSSELIENLPSELEITTQTFVVNGMNYINITEEQISKYDSVASLVLMKISDDIDEENKYMIKYSIDGNMIAFSRNLKGQFKNLIRFGSNEAESRAEMILALIEDDKL